MALTTCVPGTELGVNDLLFVATPSQLVEGMRQFVIDVRAVDAHVTVVIGQLTQTWFTNQGAPVVEQYNQMLSALAASLDQPDARVIAAARPADYTVGADTYDGSHPDASGEIKIAHQFASVLSTLALPDRPAPTTYGGAATLSAAPRFGAARLTFTTPPGATRQAIWKRNVTRNGRWRLVGYVDASVHRYRVPSLRHHHRYAFRLRAYQGNLASTTFSNRVRVRIL